jgi:ABC-type transporter Mla subunit MlaD
MAKKRTNEIAVGLTVLVVLALTVYIVVVLGDWKNFFKSKQQITVTMPYQEGLKGLTKGSPVYLGGAKIGQVTRVAIDETPDEKNEVFVYFTMEIPKEYRLFRDCRLEAKSNVLGGQASLVINDLGRKKPQIKGDIPVRLRLEGGLADAMDTMSRELDVNEPNSLINRIRYELDRNAEDSVLASLAIAMAHLKQIAVKINEQVTIEMGKDDQTLMVKVHQIATNLADISQGLKEQMNKSDEEALLAKLHKTTDNLAHISADLKGQLDKQDEEAMLSKLHKVIDNLAGISQRLKEQLDKNNDDALLAKLLKTLDELRQSNQQVQSLLRSTKGPKALSNVEEILADLDEAIRQINLLIKHQYPNIEQAIQNIVDGTGDLKEGLSDVKQQPSKLFFSKPPDKSENVK